MEREALLLQSISEQYPDVTIAIENARPYLGEGPYTYGEFPDELKHQVMCINRPNQNQPGYPSSGLYRASHDGTSQPVF
jgi:hypothetical protein